MFSLNKFDILWNSCCNKLSSFSVSRVSVFNIQFLHYISLHRNAVLIALNSKKVNWNTSLTKKHWRDHTLPNTLGEKHTVNTSIISSLVTNNIRSCKNMQKRLGSSSLPLEWMRSERLCFSIAIWSCFLCEHWFYLCFLFRHQMAVEFLHELNVPFFKVGSGDTNNFPYLEKTAKKGERGGNVFWACYSPGLLPVSGRPMVVSSGMQSMETMRRVYKTVKEHNQNFAILQCTSAYPLEAEDVNLRVITVGNTTSLCWPIIIDFRIAEKGIFKSFGSEFKSEFICSLTTGVPEGVSRYPYWVFWPRVGGQYYSCCCSSGSKGRRASCDPGQDLERKWPLSFTRAIRASWAGSLHPLGGEGDGKWHQEDVILWEAMPW